ALDLIAVAPLVGAARGRDIEVDCLAISGGWTPTIHLASQAGGKPRFDERLAAFLPGEPREAWEAAGAIDGLLDTVACMEAGAKAGAAAARALGAEAALHEIDRPDEAEPASPPQPLWEIPATRGGKRFVDFQMDVTVDDVMLARREGFKSVEHLKRYTTLGMAADQGKTSNMSGLAIMAAAEGLSIPEVGTTRFRPPYTSVALGNFPARAVGAHFKPRRLTPMHDWHVKAGAEMMTAGLWMRPRYYPIAPGETLEQAYVREAETVREKVGLVDVSTLGKIDVQGPDAAEFLDRVYANAWLKLPVGKARYGFMLREDGIVMDDGTTWRLGEQRFLMTTTTAHAGLVMAHLEHLLSVVWPELRVQVASITDQWAGSAMAGPLARDVLKGAIRGVDFATESFPVMGVRNGTLDGIPVLVARLSFSGELAYEVFCGAHHGMAVWGKLMAAGEPFGIAPYGMEALGALRIEKGHVTGNELDGRTTLGDVGFAGMAKKDRDYIGRVLSRREGLHDPKRLKMVGLVSLDGKLVRAGAQLVESADPAKPGRSLGHVTSITWSPVRDRFIALALLEGGLERQGQKLYAASPTVGEHVAAEVTAPCFFDPDGSRMRV
ncbi:MAG: glycine cleavage T C-terminal barrel domain-containing protein, partial [Kiloniellales bacterium]